MKRYFQLSWGAMLTGLTVCALSPIAVAQIQITEVMYDATVDDVWEWAEIKNTGGSAINLDGYLAFNLGDPDIFDSENGGQGPTPSLRAVIDPDTTINPGETMIIYDGFYGPNNTNNYVTDQKFRDAWGMAPTVKVLAADFWPAIVNTAEAQGQSIGFWATKSDWRSDQTIPEGGTRGSTTSFANAAFSLDFSNFSVVNNVNGHSSITWTGNGSQQDGANWVQSVSGSNGAVTSANTLIGIGSDAGNPGVTSTFGPGPNSAGLYFTEIMYDPSTDSSVPLGEYVELYNNTGSSINLAGYILDDFNGTKSAATSAGNIAAGIIPAGGKAILFNGDQQSPEAFEAVWGPGLNLVPVTNWTSMTMSLNNSPNTTPGHIQNGQQDAIGLWSDFGAYEAAYTTVDATWTPSTTDTFTYNTMTGALAVQYWSEAMGFPDASNESLTLASLDDVSFPRTAGSSWVGSADGDGFGSILNSLRHPGGDVGSPGTFVVADPGGQPGDFDGDGDVDGRDFLAWQRGESTPGGALSASDLVLWQDNYGAGGPLVALSAVPEPASLALLALAFVPVAFGRKR